MELTAAIAALAALKRPCEVTSTPIPSSSAGNYRMDSSMKERTGARRIRSRQDIDLWQALDEQTSPGTTLRAIG